MEEQRVEGFKKACEEYLNTLGVGTLRVYGRSLQLKRPTVMKKNEIIKEIISVLCGESVLRARTAVGAPVKDCYVDPSISQKIEELSLRYFGFVKQQEGPTEPKEEKNEKVLEHISLTINIDYASLKGEQKEKLAEFLNCL